MLSEGEKDDLDDLDPRYLFVTEYLARKELDLHPPRSELTYHQEQCIMFVAGMRHKLRDEMEEGADLDDDATTFRTEAAPEEMDVSDSRLLNLAARRR